MLRSFSRAYTYLNSTLVRVDHKHLLLLNPPTFLESRSNSSSSSSSSSSSTSSEDGSKCDSHDHVRTTMDNVDVLDTSGDPAIKNQNCAPSDSESIERAEVIEVLECSYQSRSETESIPPSGSTQKFEDQKQPSQEIPSRSKTESNISPSGSTQKVEDQKQPSKEINADVHKALETLDNAIMEVSAESPTVESESKLHRGHIVVVAIDFGTTYSGYAYSFTRDPSQVYMMRKWEGGDGGVVNEKTPTCILLTPEGQFHSFGYSARDSYHDLDPGQAKTWLYFDKFKMILHTTPVSIR